MNKGKDMCPRNGIDFNHPDFLKDKIPIFVCTNTNMYECDKKEDFCLYCSCLHLSFFVDKREDRPDYLEGKIPVFDCTNSRRDKCNRDDCWNCSCLQIASFK